LRKLGIASPGEKVILRHEKNPPQNYQVSLANLQIHNDEVRIGIAKIAASFARFHGLPLGNKSLVAQALRSEIPVDGIVTPIPSVVLTVEAPRPEPIEHVLAIHFAKDARILLGYVRLFGIYEFVIQLDAKWAHDGRDTLYRYDLIHCCENIATISWSVSDNLILSWFAQRQETMAYAMDRAVCLKQWLGDRNKIWVSRAMHKAMERMLALMNTGVTETVASVEAMRVGNEVLKKYGLAMEFQ
jgi:hypothetical protein